MKSVVETLNITFIRVNGTIGGANERMLQSNIALCVAVNYQSVKVENLRLAVTFLVTLFARLFGAFIRAAFFLLFVERKGTGK